MNGTSGFQEVRSSTSRSPSRIASCTSNGINSEQIPEAIFIPHTKVENCTLVNRLGDCE